MKIAKRIFLFIIINLLIVATITAVTSIFGIKPYLDAKGINYQSLAIFCLLWGFGGAFISLLLSKVMAKWMMGVKVINPETTNSIERDLLQRVYEYSRRAGLSKMPEVGIYEADELNAFATGPSKTNSLVAVSSGLLYRLNKNEVDGVLAHEVAHIANGDMVTMTLIQGVVNAFVMFVARIIAFFASQFVDEDKRSIVQFGITLVAEIALGFLGMIVVSYFSRKREFKADAGAASIGGRDNMIAALERLKLQSFDHENDQPALATLKISGKSNNWLKLFSTHPDLDDRISALKNRN